MRNTHLTRRGLLVAGASVGAVAALPLPAQTATLIDVKKDATCPCCEGWIAYLEAEGFTVAAETLSDAALEQYKTDSAIPAAARSCHTGKVAGYVLEGHVPAADIRRLLQDRPDAIGIAVPGMPYGAPGMGPEDSRDAYDVLLVQRDGTLPVFTSYPAA